MNSAEKYNIKPGQCYIPVDNSNQLLIVLDTETYSIEDDVVVFDTKHQTVRRIDCFKLAMVRYKLIPWEDLIPNPYL